MNERFKSFKIVDEVATPRGKALIYIGTPEGVAQNIPNFRGLKGQNTQLLIDGFGGNNFYGLGPHEIDATEDDHFGRFKVYAGALDTSKVSSDGEISDSALVAIGTMEHYPVPWEDLVQSFSVLYLRKFVTGLEWQHQGIASTVMQSLITDGVEMMQEILKNREHAAQFLNHPSDKAFIKSLGHETGKDDFLRLLVDGIHNYRAIYWDALGRTLQNTFLLQSLLSGYSVTYNETTRDFIDKIHANRGLKFQIKRQNKILDVSFDQRVKGVWIPKNGGKTANRIYELTKGGTIYQMNAHRVWYRAETHPVIAMTVGELLKANLKFKKKLDFFSAHSYVLNFLESFPMKVTKVPIQDELRGGAVQI